MSPPSLWWGTNETESVTQSESYCGYSEGQGRVKSPLDSTRFGSNRVFSRGSCWGYGGRFFLDGFAHVSYCRRDTVRGTIVTRTGTGQLLITYRSDLEDGDFGLGTGTRVRYRGISAESWSAGSVKRMGFRRSWCLVLLHGSRDLSRTQRLKTLLKEGRSHPWSLSSSAPAGETIDSESCRTGRDVATTLGRTTLCRQESHPRGFPSWSQWAPGQLIRFRLWDAG